MKKVIKARLKPIIERSIELLSKKDDEAFLGRMHVLAAKIQTEESIDSAVELAILAMVAEEFSKQE